MAMGMKFRFQDLRIWQRLALGFGLIIVLLIIQVAITEVTELRIQKEIEDIVQDNTRKTALLNTMSENVHIVSRRLRTTLLLRGEPAGTAEQAQGIADARGNYDKAWEALQKTPASEEGQKYRKAIADAQVTARAENNKVLELAAKGDYDAAFRQLLAARDDVEGWQTNIDKYIVYQAQQNAEGFEIIRADFIQLERLTYIMGGIIAVASILLGWLITRSITDPVRELQETIAKVRAGDFQALGATSRKDEMGDTARSVNDLLLDRMEAQQKAENENTKLNNSVVALLQAVFQLSNKDLTAKANVDETVIGTVASSINQLTDETSKVLGEVTKIAGRVGRASEKVKLQAESVNVVANEGRESVVRMVQDIANATEQMNLVAELADSTNKAAASATESTNTALERVSNTVKGMDTIRETIAETEKRIKRLGERSQEITGIINLINTIAERTHVLALNASMQAAIAGDAGRGFAVVAEEVQRLAESSRNATSQISTLVQNIQIETNETIATVGKTITEVVAGSDLARRAGDQMRETQKITANLAELVQRIADGTQMQTRSSAELRKRVEAIGLGTERTSREIESQGTETRALAEAAQALMSSVSVFTLPSSITAEIAAESAVLKKAA
jgi:methyl-accepting chemotaxis protein